jgi:HTH-type transcriptional regulator, sugar sensing transcriptional regulator
MKLTHEEALKTLGFSDKEARIYLALLEMGMGSAIGIATKAKIKRPTTYVVLDELIQKGAVIVVPRSKKKLYRAMPAQNLFEIYEERFEKAKDVLPEIQAVSKQESYKPQVLLYEGIEGVKEVLNYKLKGLAGKEIKGFYAKTTPEIMKKFEDYREYNEVLRKNNITMKGIAPADPSLKEFREKDKEFGRIFKEIPSEEYSSDVAIEIGSTFVRFFDPVNLQGLIIENSAIAKTMREIFNLVWKKQTK